MSLPRKMMSLPRKRKTRHEPGSNDGLPLAVVGWDQSLRHAASVAIDMEGSVLGYAYFSDRPMVAKRRKAHGSTLSIEARRGADRQTREVYRLVELRSWISSTLEQHLKLADELCIVIEDYALRASQGSHQLGEIGGLLKLCAIRHDECSIRLHDPLTVKIFVTGDGTADKDAVRESARKKWRGLDDWDAIDKEVAGDCWDAFSLAQMGRIELLVRGGLVSLRDLLPEERRIFTRVTTSQPTNLLDRPWIRRPATDGI